jgi:hypothetical protein
MSRIKLSTWSDVAFALSLPVVRKPCKKIKAQKEMIPPRFELGTFSVLNIDDMLD